jgi:hypothetical protein
VWLQNSAYADRGALIEQDKHLGVVEGCREALRREV